MKEYKVESIYCLSPFKENDRIEKTMNAMAQKGWEVLSVNVGEHHVLITFVKDTANK